jgi:uncharacterized membrane protein YeiH
VVFEAVRFGKPPERTLVWADAAGLALFTATGMQSLLALHLDPAVTLFLSAIGASGGGIIRDVLATRPPLVFFGEIYVTASLVGSTGFYLVTELGAPQGVALATAIAVTFLLRGIGIIYRVRLQPGRVADY